MPHGGNDFPAGAGLGGRLASSGLLDGHLAHGASELQPASPLTPDSSVSVVNTGLEWIEREFPFKSNLLWPFLCFSICAKSLLYLWPLVPGCPGTLH